MACTPCSMSSNSIPFKKLSPPSTFAVIIPAEDAQGADFEVAIGLGSNLGSPLAILRAAWLDLQGHPAIVPLALSSPYRSRPVDMESANWFVNAAALVRTRLTPHVLLHLLHTIEARHGRVRNPDAHGYQDRTLDLDLLFYGDLVLHADHLIIPHPRVEQRLFVLAPLVEIAGGRTHPLVGKTIGTLLADLKKDFANQMVERISWEGGLSSFAPEG